MCNNFFFFNYTGWRYCEGDKDEYKRSVGRRSQWSKRALPIHACQNI